MTGKSTLAARAVTLPALCVMRDGLEFHAVTVDLSIDGLRLRTRAPPRIDELLTCSIRGVGTIEARVVWAGSCDFIVRVTGLTPSPGEIARRLIHLADQRDQSSTAARVQQRIVPAVTAVTVTLGNGKSVPARIIDLSASGIALALDEALSPGDIITVGQRRARVVRRVADGVGAEFVEPVDEAAIREGAASI